MKRREFLKSAVTTGAGLIILPGGLRAAGAAGNKLNIALIGAGGRGHAHFDSIADENVVALCDVWERNLEPAAYRVGRKISYDGAAGRVTDCAEAEALQKREYRDGWTLNG